MRTEAQSSLSQLMAVVTVVLPGAVTVSGIITVAAGETTAMAG
jgi:hypothetical protein